MSELNVVTGVAGFIGRCLASRLLDEGSEVVGFDNFCRGTPDHIAAFSDHPRFFFEQVELSDRLAFASAVHRGLAQFPGREVTVWHMAANSDILAGVQDPNIDLRDTFLTTFNALSIMRDRRLRKLAFASTSAVYGPMEVPLREDLGPLFPISSYGAMKLASEGAISAAVEAHLEQAWIYRFPNVVGPFATHGVIYDLVHKLRRNPAELEVLGDGDQRKPYLLVDDVVDAMLFIRRKADAPLNYYNIGPTDCGVTVRSIAEQVVHVAAPGARIFYTGGAKGWVGDVPRFGYSVEKLASLGWTPPSTSEQAVRVAAQAIAGEGRACKP